MNIGQFGHAEHGYALYLVSKLDFELQNRPPKSGVFMKFPTANFASQRLPRSKLAVLDKKIPNPHAIGHTHTKFEHHPIKTEGALALK